MAIRNKVGPPVTGDDFYGRKLELQKAHSLLDTNHSLVLSAPRRIGKSSFARRLIEEKQAQGWKCVYVDLERIKHQDKFFETLTSEFSKSKVWKEAAGAVTDILKGIKGIGPVKLDFSNERQTSDIYSQLSDAIDHGKDTLIVVDELSLFLGSLDKTDASTDVAYFLNWFRSLRQVADTRIRWIFCGSVGLHNFTKMRNLSMTINDLFPFDFDELSEEESYGLLRALVASEGISMDEEAVDYFLKQLDWHIPYFIQLLFTSIKSKAAGSESVTIQMIDEAFEELSESNTLNTWSERLTEYNGLEKGARLLLNLLSASDDGMTRDQLMQAYISRLRLDDDLSADKDLSDVLDMLQQDGYIIRKNGRRVFRSPLLKKWWRYKYVE